MNTHFRSSVEFNRYFCISIYIRELHSKWLLLLLLPAPVLCCYTNSLCKNRREKNRNFRLLLFFRYSDNIDFVWNYLNFASGFHGVYSSFFFFSLTKTFGITCSKCLNESVYFQLCKYYILITILYHCESIWNRQNRQANKQKQMNKQTNKWFDGEKKCLFKILTVSLVCKYPFVHIVYIVSQST